MWEDGEEGEDGEDGEEGEDGGSVGEGLGEGYLPSSSPFPSSLAPGTVDEKESVCFSSCR